MSKRNVKYLFILRLKTISLKVDLECHQVILKRPFALFDHKCQDKAVKHVVKSVPS